MEKISTEVVKVKGSVPWAIKATVNEQTRYRGYRYKKEAEFNLREWSEMKPFWFHPRNFYHNFFTAEECGIRE